MLANANKCQEMPRKFQEIGSDRFKTKVPKRKSLSESVKASDPKRTFSSEVPKGSLPNESTPAKDCKRN